MLYNILRNRLRQRTNKQYVKWRAEKKQGQTELHHIIKSFMGGKKQNDLLLAEILSEYHQEITYKREPSEPEFIDMLINSLENLFDYIEYLQNDNKPKNKS